MALIDELYEEKKQENKEESKCRACKSEVTNINKRIMLCEVCFNKQIEETLKTIDANIYQIQNEMQNIKKVLVKIEEESLKLNDIIIKNKLEIDNLNATATLMKYQIDLENNMNAYLIIQNQANDFRKLSNWQLFEIDNKYQIEIKKGE